LNANLGDAAVLLFLFRGQGCAYLGLQMKAIKPCLRPVLIGFSESALHVS
jgi:hypothetical protein